jgi:hypothetical protein
MLATFSVTLGLLLWHQRRAHLQEPQTVDTETTHAADSRTTTPAMPLPRRQTGEVPAALPRPETRPAGAAEEVTKPPELTGIEVPVSVVLTGQSATLRNGSARPLDLTITASNQATGHQASAQVTLAPFQRMSIDGNEFVVEHGDLLTLHSPPFHDREIETEIN